MTILESPKNILGLNPVGSTSSQMTLAFEMIPKGGDETQCESRFSITCAQGDTIPTAPAVQHTLGIFL